MNYRAMIQNRRSVHGFREKEVPREAIGQLRSYYEKTCPRLVPEIATDVYKRQAGSDRYGALQAPHMVCVLSDGNHDAGYLQAEKQRINKDNRKEPFSWLN